MLGSPGGAGGAKSGDTRGGPRKTGGVRSMTFPANLQGIVQLAMFDDTGGYISTKSPKKIHDIPQTSHEITVFLLVEPLLFLHHF